MRSGRYWGFIKDPIWGYVQITEVEKKVIDTLPVQRLRRIRQLAGAEYVYPAANHTRFEHVIGVMRLAGMIADSLPVELGEHEKQELRLAALLHDVGHGPFSHLSEPLMVKYLGRNHEEMSSWIIRESELADVLKGEGFDPDRLGRLAIGKLENPPQPFFNQVIRSSVDADKMDFVVRDSYHTGAGYGVGVDIPRLIYTMDVMDGNLAVDVTALPTLESFMLARVESFRAIYFHKVSRASQIMLLRAMELAKEDLGMLNVKAVDDFLAQDDNTVWSTLYNNQDSKKIIMDLQRRRLLKMAYEKTFFTKEEFMAGMMANDAVRRRIEEEIAYMAGVDPEDVYIDGPSLPSVPYHYATATDPMDIPLFAKTRTGDKVPQRLSELSHILNYLKVYMNIVRVYTKEGHREAVGRAARSVFGQPTPSSAVSY